MIPRTDRICVVGGGPAGVGAAWYLHKQGYRNVTLLEQTDRIGGKARSIHVDGNTIDLGALDVASDYINVRRIAEELDAPTRITAQLGAMDFATGQASSSLKRLTANAGFLQLGRAMVSYMRAIGWTYDDFLEAPRMTDVPPELTVTMGEWLDKGGMGCLRPMFDYVCTGFGYGPLDKIPAAYLLRFVDFGDFIEMLKVDLGIRSWPRNFTKGYANLCIMMARNLPDVRVNSAVESVVRQPGTADPVSVHVRGQPDPLCFDQLIMACRLDSTLAGIVQGLQPEAKSLFGKVRYQPYSTAVCRTRGIPWISLGAVPLPAAGHVYCMIQPWQGGDATAFYIMNPEGLSADQIHRNIRDDLARITTLDGVRCDFKVEELVEYVEWTYFPHFSCADLADGAYDRIEALQGQANTYFTGGLLGFETVHNSLAHAESIVHRYFTPE